MFILLASKLVTNTPLSQLGCVSGNSVQPDCVMTGLTYMLCAVTAPSCCMFIFLCVLTKKDTDSMEVVERRFFAVLINYYLLTAYM